MKLTDKMDIKALDVSELSDENLAYIKTLVGIEQQERRTTNKLTKRSVGKTDLDALIESGVIAGGKQELNPTDLAKYKQRKQHNYEAVTGVKPRPEILTENGIPQY